MLLPSFRSAGFFLSVGSDPRYRVTPHPVPLLVSTEIAFSNFASHIYICSLDSKHSGYLAPYYGMYGVSLILKAGWPRGQWQDIASFRTASWANRSQPISELAPAEGICANAALIIFSKVALSSPTEP